MSNIVPSPDHRNTNTQIMRNALKKIAFGEAVSGHHSVQKNAQIVAYLALGGRIIDGKMVDSKEIL